MLFISEEEREGRRLGRLQQSSKEDSARMQGQTQEENCIKTTFLPGHKWVEVLRKDVHNMEVVVDLEKHHLGLQLVTLTVVSVQLVNTLCDRSEKHILMACTNVVSCSVENYLKYPSFSQSL